MKTREQALRELGLVIAEFTAAFMTQTPEEAARRAWRPDGPPLEELAERCAALQGKLRHGVAPTKESSPSGPRGVNRRGR